MEGKRKVCHGGKVLCPQKMKPRQQRVFRALIWKWECQQGPWIHSSHRPLVEGRNLVPMSGFQDWLQCKNA